MIYDAIVNGARAVNFYGGNIPGCWNFTDSTYQWNWTFWENVLEGLIREINASSPIAPALVNTGSNQVLPTSDPSTQAIRRQGVPGEVWVIATRGGAGTQSVTIDGLPPGATNGSVYTEGRSVTAANGSFTDTFDRWDTHVYRFVVATPTAVGVSRFAARRTRSGVRLTWRTGSETAIAGFELYRERGRTRVRLAPRLIDASGGTAGRAYSWLAPRPPEGRDWTYRLRVVHTSGRRSWAGSALAR